jgi:hypothetical protein
MRAPDTLDYVLIAAITVLAYLHLPWRPQIRDALRGGVSAVASLFSPTPESLVVGLVAVGVVLLVLLVEVLPGRNGP